MAEPSRLGFADRDDAGRVSGFVTDAGHDGWVHRVHEPVVDLADRSLKNHEDRDGDTDANDGIGPLEPRPRAERAEHDREGGEAVGAGVVAVSHERGGPDGVAFADAIQRDELIPEEADKPS